MPSKFQHTTCIIFKFSLDWFGLYVSSIFQAVDTALPMMWISSYILRSMLAFNNFSQIQASYTLPINLMPGFVYGFNFLFCMLFFLVSIVNFVFLCINLGILYFKISFHYERCNKSGAYTSQGATPVNYTSVTDWHMV